jgi:hypothetical protein
MSGERAAKALALYEAKSPDAEIARELGVSRPTVRRWRRESGLPRLFGRGEGGWRNGRLACYVVVGEEESRALALYRAGASDGAIGEKLGRDRTTIMDWRRRRGLPSNNAIRPKADNPAFRCALWARASRAVGASLSPDIRDDAISDIVLAVLSGSLPEESIEAQARKLSNRTLGAWASRFGPASLDEDRDGEGWTLYASIADDRQASALRVAELVALAERLGLDVGAILGEEDELEEPSGRAARRARPCWDAPLAAEREYPLVGEAGRSRWEAQSWV